MRIVIWTLLCLWACIFTAEAQFSEEFIPSQRTPIGLVHDARFQCSFFIFRTQVKHHCVGGGSPVTVVSMQDLNGYYIVDWLPQITSQGFFVFFVRRPSMLPQAMQLAALKSEATISESLFIYSYFYNLFRGSGNTNLPAPKPKADVALSNDGSQIYALTFESATSTRTQLLSIQVADRTSIATSVIGTITLNSATNRFPPSFAQTASGDIYFQSNNGTANAYAIFYKPISGSFVQLPRTVPGGLTVSALHGPVAVNATHIGYMALTSQSPPRLIPHFSNGAVVEMLNSITLPYTNDYYDLAGFNSGIYVAYFSGANNQGQFWFVDRFQSTISNVTSPVSIIYDIMSPLSSRPVAVTATSHRFFTSGSAVTVRNQLAMSMLASVSNGYIFTTSKNSATATPAVVIYSATTNRVLADGVTVCDSASYESGQPVGIIATRTQNNDYVLATARPSGLWVEYWTVTPVSGITATFNERIKLVNSPFADAADFGAVGYTFRQVLNSTVLILEAITVGRAYGPPVIAMTTTDPVGIATMRSKSTPEPACPAGISLEAWNVMPQDRQIVFASKRYNSLLYDVHSADISDQQLLTSANLLETLTAIDLTSRISGLPVVLNPKNASEFLYLSDNNNASVSYAYINGTKFSRVNLFYTTYPGYSVTTAFDTSTMTSAIYTTDYNGAIEPNVSICVLRTTFASGVSSTCRTNVRFYPLKLFSVPDGTVIGVEYDRLNGSILQFRALSATEDPTIFRLGTHVFNNLWTFPGSGRFIVVSRALTGGQTRTFVCTSISSCTQITSLCSGTGCANANNPYFCGWTTTGRLVAYELLISQTNGRFLVITTAPLATNTVARTNGGAIVGCHQLAPDVFVAVSSGSYAILHATNLIIENATSIQSTEIFTTIHDVRVMNNGYGGTHLLAQVTDPDSSFPQIVRLLTYCTVGSQCSPSQVCIRNRCVTPQAPSSAGIVFEAPVAPPPISPPTFPPISPPVASPVATATPETSVAPESTPTPTPPVEALGPITVIPSSPPLVPPSSPVPSLIPVSSSTCLPPQPPGSICSAGVWRVNGSLIINSTFVVNSPVLATGALIIQNTSVLTISPPGIVTTQGCVQLGGSLQTSIDATTTSNNTAFTLITFTQGYCGGNPTTFSNETILIRRPPTECEQTSGSVSYGPSSVSVVMILTVPDSCNAGVATPSGISTGAIVGIIIGCIVAVILICILLWVYRRKFIPAYRAEAEFKKEQAMDKFKNT